MTATSSSACSADKPRLGAVAISRPVTSVARTRSATLSAASARRLRTASGRRTTATGRPCRVMTISSPVPTRSRISGRAARASLAVMVAIAGIVRRRAVTYNQIARQPRCRTAPPHGSPAPEPSAPRRTPHGRGTAGVAPPTAGRRWSRSFPRIVQIQVEVAASEALDLGDTEGVAVEVLDMGVHADAVALVRGAVDHDLHWHSLAVRRQGSDEQPTGTLLPEAVGSEGDVGVGGGVQQRCGPHVVVPPRLVRAEAAGVHGHNDSRGGDRIRDQQFAGGDRERRLHRAQTEHVASGVRHLERWGSTRYLPAAGTASDGASPKAITASLRLVLPAKLLGRSRCGSSKVRGNRPSCSAAVPGDVVGCRRAVLAGTALASPAPPVSGSAHRSDIGRPSDCLLYT